VQEGRGEATPIYYHGETAEGCAQAIGDYCAALGSQSLSREAVQAAMPRGAARNALDCALWDLESRRQGVPVWQLAGLAEPKPLPTAYTISIDAPARMESDARAAAGRGFRLLKCKLGGEGDMERIAAVRQGAPDVRLIVDANESWNDLDIAAEAAALGALGVELIEQPVRRGQEQRLSGVTSLVPFCADESCQDRADMPALASFPVINIKLDKAGGLTEAIALRDAAIEQGKKLMLGLYALDLARHCARISAGGRGGLGRPRRRAFARAGQGGRPLYAGRPAPSRHALGTSALIIPWGADRARSSSRPARR
jgi:L-alanine-DL-glutamate epimerase-like enolase superfamily enzyme